MKNFIQAGNVVTLTAPYALASGDGALVGSIFGLATNAASSAASVELFVGQCVAEVTALSTDTGAAGIKMYWDNTNKRATVTSTSNSLIGVLMLAKVTATTVATIRLNGISI